MKEYYQGREFLDKLSRLFIYFQAKRNRNYNTPVANFYQNKMDRILKLRKNWGLRNLICR